MEMMWDWGIRLVIFLQTFESWLLPMQMLTFTGSTEFFLLILPVLYWSLDRRLGVRMAVLLLLTILVGSILKVLGHGPRPYWIAPGVQLLSGPEATFGLPSIHTMNAVVMWSLLAHAWGRAWGWVLALLLMALAGVARLYLGVHFPSDVLAGWLVGALILWGWWRWSESIGRWFRGLNSPQQLLLTALVSFGTVGLGALVRELTIRTWDAAAGWPGRAGQAVEYLSTAFSIADVVTAAGVLLGMVVGLLFCDSLHLTSAPGTLLRRLGQYVLGVVGVLLVWQGLDVAFSQLAVEESGMGYVLRYIRYALVGFWIFGLAPLLFVRLRLTQRALTS